MATPKPGEIRCPTCHRSTQPAAYCTQCGSPIPADARARPRGLDRDELQERIRARRTGGDPYRRGGAWEGDEPYGRFEPEPEDETARRGRRVAAPRIDRLDERGAAVPPVMPPPDITREPEPDRWERWSDPNADPPARMEAPAPPSAAIADAAAESAPSYLPPAPPDDGDDTDRDIYPEDAYAYDIEDYPEYAAYEEPRRSAGGGGFVILGVLALGVLALLGGAFLAGSFGSGGVAEASPTPSASLAATPEPTVAATAAPTVSTPAGGTPAATSGPITFPDGFVAVAQACLPGSATGDGCDSNGAVNQGSLWVWVGFRNGTEDDVITATLLGPDDTQLAEGSIDLARIGCEPDCPGGWTYFPFSGLDPGMYTVRVTRNGDPADEIGFEVS